MDSLKPNLARFERRVRLARAVRFLCWFTLGASGIATICAVLDLLGIFYVNVVPLGIFIGSGSLAGFVYGFTQRVSADALAASIDRRSGLQDRLSTAIGAPESGFSELLKAGAESKLAQVSEKQTFPIRFGRGQFGMMFSFVLPFVVLFVSYHHLLMSAAERQEREEVRAQAAPVRHVLESLTKSPAVDPKQADLVKQLQRLQKDLERGNLNRQAAKERADRISEEAERLMHEVNKQTRQSLDAAQEAMDRAKAEKSDESSNDLGSKNPDSKDAGQKMSEKDLKALASSPDKSTKEKLDELNKQIEKTEKQLDQKDLSQAQRSQLEKQLQSLKLSKEAQEMLQRMQNNPEFKKLQEMMEKLRKNADQSDQGEQQSMTAEEMKQMEQELEEMAKELKDDKAMSEYLKKMEEAMKEAMEAGDMNTVRMLMAGMQMGGAPSTTPGPPSGAHLNMSDKEEKGLGATHEIGIRADQKPTGEPAPYIEQKGMAKPTGPSSIPLLKDVAASRRKAEEAIDKQRVPKEERERVKRYFEALEGNK